MVMTIQAYAAHKADGKLEPFEYELGSLKPDKVGRYRILWHMS